MKIYYLFFLLVFVFISCKKEIEPITVPDVPSNPTQPTDQEDTISVNMDLTLVPFEKLSDYRFFVGDLKQMLPNEGVLPFEPITPLFTDYAAKKRFVWMPSGVKATYVSDGEVFNFPTGTVLIKSFYYQNMLPSNAQFIIETRLMIKRSSGWFFANYIWNEEQTEAFLDDAGLNVAISFVRNGSTYNTSYRIPSNTECMVCHKKVDDPVPIGVKPQHLNKQFNYVDGSMNQLDKWIEKGYLNSRPGQILSLVDYSDESKSLNERVRSYLDINCAHCHADQKHCDYRPIRLAFNETINMVNLGLCVDADEQVVPGVQQIITPMNYMRSMLHYRLSTNEEALRMPLLGRTMVHQEGVDLLEQYINTIQSCE